MAKIAVTFPGKLGDQMYALASVREIARQNGEPVDFYVMPHFSGACDLYSLQEYINKAQGLEGWNVDYTAALQPWEHQRIEGYDQVIDLGYNEWPHDPLIYLTARRAGVQLTEPILPYMDYPLPVKTKVDVAIGYSVYYWSDVLNQFVEEYISKIREVYPDTTFANLSDPVENPWLKVGEVLKGCKIFIGDKSSMHVLAHAMNKFVIEGENNHERRTYVFNNPYAYNVWRMDKPGNVELLDMVDEYVAVTLDQLSKS